MKRITALLIAATLLGGCFVTTHDHRPRGASKKGDRCRPSHHWENGHCVHNGKGKGARKHDY